MTALMACAAHGGATVPNVQPAAREGEHPSQGLLVHSSVPELNRAVTSFGAAWHDGALYLFGGYFGVPHAYSRDGQSGELTRIDVARGTTQSLFSGTGVQGAQLVSTQAGLVRVGGMRAENARGEPERVVSLDEVARFDAATQRWQPLPSLPQPRSSHAAVVHEGKLYVLGGWTLAGLRTSGVFNQGMLVFDFATASWSSKAQPFRARALAAAVLQGKVVVVGGLDEHGKALRECHVFDPATGSWSRGPEYPEDAFGIAMASTGDRLYASARDGIVHELSDAQGSWQPVAALAFPRFFHQLVALDDQHLVALGGISGMHLGDRVAHVETLDLRDPAPRVLSFLLKNPSVAKNRQGVQVIDDALVVFGGNRSLAQHDFGADDFLTEAYALQLASLRKEPLPPFPVGRQTMQSLALEGQLLAIGGFGFDGQRARAQADAYLLDLSAEQWTPYASPLPEPRTQFGLTERAGELWVFGGLNYDPARSQAEQMHHPLPVLSGKLGDPIVATDITLPRARRAFGGALLDDHYFLVGGMNEAFQPVAECDVFAFETKSWSSIACPAPRISPQLVALDGKLYLAGGSTFAEGELVPSPRLEVYDPAQGSWSTLMEQIPIEPHQLSMRAYRHALVLFSSHRSDDLAQLSLVVPPVRRSEHADAPLNQPLVSAP